MYTMLKPVLSAMLLCKGGKPERNKTKQKRAKSLYKTEEIDLLKIKKMYTLNIFHLCLVLKIFFKCI